MHTRNLAATSVAAASLITAAVFAVPAGAGSVSGGGWTASWDDAGFEAIDVQVLSEGEDEVRFTKFVNFTHAPSHLDRIYEPLRITFERTGADAARSVVFDSERLLNNTEIDWRGFDFILDAATDEPGPTFDAGRTFAASDPFDLDGFGDWAVSDDGARLRVDDGRLSASGGINEWEPGLASGALFIDAGEGGGFDLLEQPLAVLLTDPDPDPDPGPDPEPTPIPLPAGALSAMTTMGGLGLLGVGRTLIRRRRPPPSAR